MPESQGVATLDALLLPLALQRLALYGEHESGAYNFYARRLESGSLFAGYEIALAEKLLERRFPVREIHEIGPGFGQLPMLLAVNGLPATGIEGDSRRYATAATLLDEMRRAFPAAAPCRMLHGSFPLPRPAAPPARDALALTTNLIFTTTPAQQNLFVAALRRYPFVIADVDRLFEPRRTADERAAAFALFASNGFGPPEPFLDLGEDGRYFLFRPPSAQTAFKAVALAVAAAAADFAAARPGEDTGTTGSDAATLEAIFAQLPRYETYVETGPGLGQLAAMVAACGRPAVKVAPDGQRFLAATGFQTHLRMRMPGRLDGLATCRAAFPGPLPGVDRAGTLLLAVEPVAGEVAALAAEMVAFDGILADVAALGEALATALAARRRDAGLPPPVMLAAADGASRRLAWFDNRRANALG